MNTFLKFAYNTPLQLFELHDPHFRSVYTILAFHIMYRINHPKRVLLSFESLIRMPFLLGHWVYYTW
jgi:hypothetical protein